MAAGRLADMLVHRYDTPDRFVAGTVGEPGDRTFFLQAREGNRVTSVACEKQQVSVLAEHLTKMLDEVALRGMARGPLPEPTDRVRDTEPLDAPISEEFRVGDMTLAWEANRDRVVIELFSTSEAGEDDPEIVALTDDEDEDTGDEDSEADAGSRAAEVCVVSISADNARDFVARAEALIAAGRPPCPFCLQPLEPEGHICPRANGYRRPLF